MIIGSIDRLHELAKRRLTHSVVVGVFVMLAAAALSSPASAAYSPKLRRYPYLTNTVQTVATVNWATDRSADTAVVKWGRAGAEPCTTNVATAIKTPIAVNSVLEYQWKATMSGLTPNTAYCYRVYLGASPEVDLLGGDHSPTFQSQVQDGSTDSYKFAVFGDWGAVNADGKNSHQEHLEQKIATSGAEFAVTTGDQPHQGATQTNYGDLTYSKSLIFGSHFWAVPGRSIPLFLSVGNHGLVSTFFQNWPEAAPVASSGGRYRMETYCCLNGTTSHAYPSVWYAFDVGSARFYVLGTSWDRANVGTASIYENDYDYHWTPTSAEYQWLENDLATHPSALKFAVFHFPLYSDTSSQESDTFLQGPGSLEGLLSRYGVDIAFNGHAHLYERNLKPNADSLITYITGAGGTIDLASVATCSSFDAYAIGWSDSTNKGTACNAKIPGGKEQIYNFLLVSVSGSTVTVTPTNEKGEHFDVQTYQFPPSP
jgi:Calcineurin-like phosphoesterase/Purple acid Phosphatase, N-terminal domain